jgi:hypothetical protein
METPRNTHNTTHPLFFFLHQKNLIKESTPHYTHFLSHINGPAGPKFMFEERKKNKKERKKMGNKRKRC